MITVTYNQISGDIISIQEGIIVIDVLDIAKEDLVICKNKLIPCHIKDSQQGAELFEYLKDWTYIDTVSKEYKENQKMLKKLGYDINDVSKITPNVIVRGGKLLENDEYNTGDIGFNDIETAEKYIKIHKKEGGEAANKFLESL